SPDGKYLASGNADQAIHLWELSIGKERRQLVGHQGALTSLAFSPDSKTLASAEGGPTVRLWDVATGKEKLQVVAQGRACTIVVFLADGKTLASAHLDGSIRFCEASTGKEIRLISSRQTAAADGGDRRAPAGGPGGGFPGG